MREETKYRLAAKLIDRPLLRLLLFDVWFRVAFVCLALLGIAGGLMLPKIWQTSPEDFMPVVKVSGLDLIQAWSLKGTAREKMRAGDYEQASMSWQTAIANNRGDPDLVRGYLDCVRESPLPREKVTSAFHYSYWLLRLTETNRSDLELVAGLFEKYRYSDSLLGLLEPQREEFTPELKAAYLKALFNTGRIARFRQYWEQERQNLPEDKELMYYRAAYVAGWGPGEERSEAQKRLTAAQSDPDHAVLAHRLQLRVSAHLSDADRYQKSLQWLVEKRLDSVHAHTTYWRLLDSLGRKKEAVNLAQTTFLNPTSPGEVIDLAQVHNRLGMQDQALEILRQFTTEFGKSVHLWTIYAEELIRAKEWEALQNLVGQLRVVEDVGDELSGYSYYLEGRAKLGMDHQGSAEAAFERIPQAGIGSPYLAFNIAKEMTRLGYPRVSRDLLLNMEENLKDAPAYWHQLFVAADQLKDVELMLKAGREAYRLQPNHPTIANNYAATLLLARKKPEEAIKITLSLMSKQPGSVMLRINHGAALLQNDRLREAQKVLSEISPAQLSPAQASLYYLDRLEAAMKLNELDQARKIHQKIQPDHLYPPQRRWYEQVTQELGAPPAAG